MPTYDYQCKNCQHTWELFQSIKAAPVKKCPECGKNQAQRMIGPGAGIIFKGSGFYITDYRSDSYKKAAAAEGKSSDGGKGGAGSSKSESTASAKPEKKNSSKPKSE